MRCSGRLAKGMDGGNRCICVGAVILLLHQCAEPELGMASKPQHPHLSNGFHRSLGKIKGGVQKELDVPPALVGAW